MVEGRVLLAEALRAAWPVEAVFVPAGSDVASDVTGVARHELAAGVIERVATTESPKDVMAIVRQRPASLPAGATFVVVCAGVSDPGNLGTIVRSAEAAGADAVACTPGTVDVWSPKTVRASAGAVFHVPIVELGGQGDHDDDVDLLPSAGLRLVGTSSHPEQAPVDHTAFDLTQPVALVMGSEAHGVPSSVPVSSWVRIPHAGRSESLNVAMAATVLCFEVSRQRRAAAGTLPG